MDTMAQLLNKNPFTSLLHLTTTMNMSTTSKKKLQTATTKLTMQHMLRSNEMLQMQKQSAELNSGSSTARKLQSGFQIARASHSANNIDKVKVVLQKHEQGDNPISHQKTHSKVVRALKPEISAGYDMNSILMIPQDVDYKNPATVSKARVFFNPIDDWQKLEDEDYLQWQEFVLLHGSSVEVESDNWLEETLLLSMETTLRSEVESDMKSLPLQKQKGAISMLCFIIKHMVVRNQEAKDALETYFEDIRHHSLPRRKCSDCMPAPKGRCSGFGQQ
jgi:hypothetical protein